MEYFLKFITKKSRKKILDLPVTDKTIAINFIRRRFRDLRESFSEEVEEVMKGFVVEENSQGEGVYMSVVNFTRKYPSFTKAFFDSKKNDLPGFKDVVIKKIGILYFVNVEAFWKWIDDFNSQNTPPLEYTREKDSTVTIKKPSIWSKIRGYSVTIATPSTWSKSKGCSVHKKE